MRTRLSKDDRRKDILAKARRLIAERGLADTEMEDIRNACGISRGGLYHHFPGKRAVLDALVAEEVAEIAETLNDPAAPPIAALIGAGSRHLWADPGLLSALRSREERLEYLSALEVAFDALLREPLRARLADHVKPGVDAAHVAELFLTVNAHINRREILGQWSQRAAAGFAATALAALAPLLGPSANLEPIIDALNAKAESR